MTLTALLPTLRRTLPDALDIDAWPEFTRATLDDVIVAGVSLLRLVDVCGTPCIHTAAAVEPGTRGRPSEVRLASVVVVRVESVSVDDRGRRMLTVDGVLSACRPILREARLVGRISPAHVAPASVQSLRSGEAPPLQLDADLLSTVLLPMDTSPGDILAIPCLGTTPLHDVRTARAIARPTGVDSESHTDVEHDADRFSHCAR